MKTLLSAIAISSLLITAVYAEEAATQPAKADSATEDCSKQVWPNFSPSCLRSVRETGHSRFRWNGAELARASNCDRRYQEMPLIPACSRADLEQRQPQ